MTAMAIDPHTVFMLGQAVFQDFLGLAIREQADRPPIEGPMVTSLVHISGDFKGAVYVQAGTTLATEISAAMFMMQPDELSEDEVRDAMGEVANMLAGSIRTVLDPSGALSLPIVCIGDTYDLWVSGTHVRERMGCLCLGKPMTIIVTEQD